MPMATNGNQRRSVRFNISLASFFATQVM